MEKTISPNQTKALFVWGWLLWIGCAYWLARFPWTDNAELSLKGFAFLILLPKAIQGFFYTITPKQNRFSDGYTDKHKRLPLYTAAAMGIGLWIAATALHDLTHAL
ncbi:hypothetical protein J5H75_18610 [Pseudomonas asiatica]|uniref:hypothetical protein n=1 Tax=Pseudomonas asiatica TaxID=2219225 RepID=UPI001AAF82FB|nr:hypothetical protein [Pseudomonas asiatica]MBO2923692.1 hypothetical protein [Pseudomonas asiatica]